MPDTFNTGRTCSSELTEFYCCCTQISKELVMAEIVQHR